MAVAWTEETAAHLYSRAGFGESSQRVKAAAKAGMQKTVASLFKIAASNDKLPDKYDSLEMLQSWWIDRMLRTKNVLQERMTLYWHNHFATGIAKVGDVNYMHRQNQTLRKGSLGKFRDLVTAVAKDPAMLRWLDNNTNTKKKPNLNFARELMELFTCGVLDKNGAPNYTETDIAESARAFTGWTIKDDAFYFNAGNHDGGSKTFRGHTGAFDGTDIINFLVVDPATARRVTQRLWSYFAYDIALNDPIIDELSQVFLDNDTAIQPVLERIFSHDSFYSDAAKTAGVKEPAVFTVTLLRSLKAKLQPRLKNKNDNGGNFGGRFQALGQSLFDPPTVFGWKYGLAWVGASGLLDRANFAQWVAAQRKPDNPIVFNPKILIAGPGKPDAAVLATRLLASVGIHSPAATTVSAIATYLAAQDNGQAGELKTDPDFVDTKVRGALALIAATAEFQAA